MITELYGLPGAGKSTMIQKLTGGSSTSISSIKGVKKVFIHLIKKIAVYLPSSMGYKSKMHIIMKPYKNKPQYINRTKLYHYNSIVLVSFGYRHLRGNVYMDEGLIHRIISMAVNYGVSDQDLFALIDLFDSVMKKVKSFYLNVSLDDCLQAISFRNRHECEMDELNEDQLLAYLRAYEHCCRIICNKYQHVIITRNYYRDMR